jgi:O-antigen ligase
VAALVLAIGGFTLLPAGYANRLSTIQNIEADPTGSAQDRWADTKTAVHYMITHPIVGCGVGQNMLALNEARGMQWKEVHNVYLEYGVELGFPGLILFVVLLWSSIGRARRAQRLAAEVGRKDVASIAEGIEVALMGFSIASFFHPVAYHFYFYLFAGLAIGAETSALAAQRECRPERSVAGPWWSPAVRPALVEAVRT